ncbi:histidinol-phosphate transaminase [Liberiplasma polymorphum]|uniref:histidinol-phosphate transaminase n=1 Tax=Liberiplasma polymorphum TaxID=3374570 RepID=UPI003773642F
MIKPKKAIISLKGYEPNLNPYLVKLDANEEKDYLSDKIVKNTVFPMNLYPDNDNTSLSIAIANKWQVSTSEVIVGNGSSEILELLVKTFVDKDEVVISFEPSFSMYKIYATINGATYIPVLPNEDFSLNVSTLLSAINEYNPKLIFLCTPNNPTGYLIPKEAIIEILDQTQAIVVVDEAYMEFSTQDTSVIDLINTFDNLIVTRTFSKAYGLASLRLGYGLANERLISLLKKVKAPYSVNAYSQIIGQNALDLESEMVRYTEASKNRRINLAKSLSDLGIQIYPSEGNFIFFKSKQNLYEDLINKGIMIRSFSGELANYYRVTVGSEEENALFINAMEAIINE